MNEDEDIISSDDDGDDDDDGGVTVILTADEILMHGLKYVGYTDRRIARVKTEKTNIDRFVGHFGSTPVVVATIWEDLQRTQVYLARVPPEHLSIDNLLMAMHFLKRYPTELEREAIFDVSASWGRDNAWYYLERVQALKAEKIIWPADNFGDDIWVLTVDGIHSWTSEPGHPEWSQDRTFYSHKHGKAGLDYELGISIATQHLVWMNGPFRAGLNDKAVFAQPGGLKAKLRAMGKKGIGDNGYTGHHEQVSTPNSHDSKEVALFKSRALKRHEKFNGLIKNFGCFQGRFHHNRARFKIAFEAVCVICQYQIESDKYLFDVLIDGMIDDEE